MLRAIVAFGSRSPLSRSRRARAGALQQQRRIALHEPRQRRGDLDRRHVVLCLVLLDQLLERTELARRASVSPMRCLNFAMRLSLTVFDARQLHFGDRLARGALDRLQHALFARRHEQDRLAAAAGAAGAADAVHVGFGVVRNVVVQHVADALDVEPARGDVGRDQDVELAVLQLLDRALALRLHDVAVDRRRGKTARLQLLGKFLGRLLGAREHQHRVERLGFEDARQRVELVQAADPPVALADVRRRWSSSILMLISIGLRRYVCAMRRIGVGIVAEKSAI